MQPVSRRGFLGLAAGVVGGFVVGAQVGQPGAAPRPKPTTTTAATTTTTAATTTTLAACDPTTTTTLADPTTTALAATTTTAAATGNGDIYADSYGEAA